MTLLAIKVDAAGPMDEDIVSIDELVPICGLEPLTVESARSRFATSGRPGWPASLLALMIATLGTAALLHSGSDPAAPPGQPAREAAVPAPVFEVRPRTRGLSRRGVRDRHRRPRRQPRPPARRQPRIRQQPRSTAPSRPTPRRPSSPAARTSHVQTATVRPPCEFEPSCNATGTSP